MFSPEVSLLFFSEPVDGKVRPSVPSLYAGKTATPRRIEPSGRKNEPSQSPAGGEEGMRAGADMSSAITVSDRASCGLRKSVFPRGSAPVRSEWRVCGRLGSDRGLVSA